VHKEICKETKETATKVFIKTKNEMWDETCSKLNCKLGFKRSREAWAN
jgi:hypothetical protein